MTNSIFDSCLIRNVLKPIANTPGDKYNRLLDDYKKFNNKPVKTIIFALSIDKYIQMEWSNVHDHIIIKKLREKILNKFMRHLK